jgi:hypothetical protein
VILQRIKLGLSPLLGGIGATANWRAISEVIWPFVQGSVSTPWARPRPPGWPGTAASRRNWPEPAA